MSVRILHLTDLHLGPGELVAEDMKQKIPDAERGRLIERLTDYLEVLPQPDFVVISGDLTNRGERQGIKDVHTWLSKRIKQGTLPGPDRILVVPGNHDVKWFVPESLTWHTERYRNFFEIIGRAFPHSYLPGCDPTLDPNQPDFRTTPKEIIGGLCTASEMGDVVVKSSYPFLLDLRREVLLFAFNSTLACGVYIYPPKGVDKQWDALLEMYKGSTDLHAQLTKLRDAYKASLAIDAGMIGHDQLEYFSKLMRRMRQELGSKYSRLTKVAVLHHHISHLWNQQLEVKSFESTIDAHEVKKRLVEFGFDVVLHGHKHTNHVGIDASVIPISSRQRLNPLCIISGGTICGYPPLQQRQTFKWIDLPGDTGPRENATVTETPLLDAGDPAAVIASESVIYNIPVAPRLPELHDLSSVKSDLDHFLISKYVSDRGSKKGGALSWDTALPRFHPDLVNAEARYRCVASAVTGKMHWFYEVLLATKRLDFRHRSRIYWLLTDVKRFSENNGSDCKVVLIIGNLAQTHFRETTTETEVEESIERLRKWFKPAVDKGFLQIRIHKFKQIEVERFAKQIATGQKKERRNRA